MTDHNLAEFVRSSFSERHYFKNRNKVERKKTLVGLYMHPWGCPYMHIHDQVHTHTTDTQSVASVFTTGQDKLIMYSHDTESGRISESRSWRPALAI